MWTPNQAVQKAKCKEQNMLPQMMASYTTAARILAAASLQMLTETTRAFPVYSRIMSCL